MCRYNYGGKYCAHRMVEARECIGECNCFERAAPSYHCRVPKVKERVQEKRFGHPQLSLFVNRIDLQAVSFGSPLSNGGN